MYKYLHGWHRGDRDKLFSVLPRARTETHEVPLRIFFHCEGDREVMHIAQRDTGDSHPGDVQKPSGHSLAHSSRKQSLSREVGPEHSSHPRHFCKSVFL